MAITMKDVAERSGVSRPTVSLILNGRGERYSKQTRERVLQAARDLDYKPNILARSFHQQKSFLIGVLSNGVNYMHNTEFCRGVQAVLMKKGYAPVTFTHASCIEEIQCIEQALDRRVDGVIVNVAIEEDGRTNVQRFREIADNGMAMVEVFGHFIDGVPSVAYDYHLAGLAATRHFIQQGHKRIVMFTHDQYDYQKKFPGLHWNAWDYYRGYIQAMEEANLTPHIKTYALQMDQTREGAQSIGAAEAARKLLEKEHPPTAVLCITAEVAQVLAMYMAEHSHELAERVSICTPGERLVMGCSTNLTLLELPAFQIGQQATEMLFRQVEKQQTRQEQTDITLPLIPLQAGMTEIDS